MKLAMLADIVKQVISVTTVRRVNSANIVKPVDTRDPREGGCDICRTACTGLVMGRRTLTHGEAPA